MKRERINLFYALMQGSEWALDSCLYGYSSVFLLFCGLRNSQIGIILGSAVALSAFGQMVLGGYFNQRGQAALYRFFVSGCGFIILGSLFILICMPNLWAAAVFLIIALLLQLFPAFMNSAAVYEIKKGAPIRYGIGRGSGSAGYAIGTVLMGQLILRHGPRCMFIGAIALAALFMYSIRGFFERTSGQDSDESKMRRTLRNDAHKGSGGSFFMKYKRYSAVLAGSVLVMMGHTFMSNYIYQILSSRGGNEGTVGFAMAIAAGVEMPVLFLFDRYKNRLSCDKWFVLSCVILTVKMSLTLLARSLAQTVLTELLQMGYALFVVSSVYYTSGVIDGEDSIRSQAYMNAASTVGVLLSLLAGGFLIDGWGVQALLRVSVAMLSIGTVVVAVFTGGNGYTEADRQAGEEI